MRLHELGTRICILGPSNSGKSTLAAAIARARNLTAVHLDQLYHLPDTDWQPRPPAEFIQLHNEAIAGERWVMDGNYSRFFPERFARATGFILLDLPTPISLMRYFSRTLFGKRERIGALAGGRDSLKWDMIRHIVITSPANWKRYAKLLNEIDLPRIYLPSAQAIDRFYLTESLPRQDFKK